MAMFYTEEYAYHSMVPYGAARALTLHIQPRMLSVLFKQGALEE